MRSSVSLALSFAAGVTACASSPSPAAPSADARAPYPYTTEEVRAACGPGHTLVVREEAAGAPTTRTTFHFLASTPTEAEIEITKSDDTGRPLAPPKRLRVPWAELHEHAAFPAAATMISDAPVTVPAGTFETRLYTVQKGPGDVAVYYFAKGHAGPPVFWYEDKGGQRATTTTMVSIVE